MSAIIGVGISEQEDELALHRINSHLRTGDWGEPEGGAAGGDGSAQCGRANSGGDAVVHVRCSNRNKFTVEEDLGTTVMALKGLLVERMDVPADQQRLIFKGRVLKDDQVLSSYMSVSWATDSAMVVIVNGKSGFRICLSSPESIWMRREKLGFEKIVYIG